MLTIKPAIVFTSPPLLHVTKSPPPFRFPSSNATATSPSTHSLKFRVSSSSSPNPTAEIDREEEVESRADIVRKFYEGVNRQDLATVEELIAENKVNIGRDVFVLYLYRGIPDGFTFDTMHSKIDIWFDTTSDILQFFRKFNDSIGKDLQFVIDDLSTNDSAAVGATWHLEWNGKPFPFSKGCSFYRLEVINGK